LSSGSFGRLKISPGVSTVSNKDVSELGPVSLVLGGGVGLGAYHVGAFEIFESAGLNISSISGASIGAVNGAIIASNPPEHRLAKLKAFWGAIEVEAFPSAWFDPWGLGSTGHARRSRNWVNALTTGLAGSPRLFVPRAVSAGRGQSRSLYDNNVASQTLSSFVDFERLNDGPVRFCLAATDVIAGAAVFYDTAKGDRIEVEHLLASSSLLPAFEPIQVGERLLADGGLACNLPLEAEIGPGRSGRPAPLCFALDLFTAGGGVPKPLNQVVENSLDLMFGMQTRMRLDGLVREWALKAKLREALQSGERDDNDTSGVDLFMLSYRGSDEDAGFGKPFDLSPATIADRMEEGRMAAKRALGLALAMNAEPHGNLKVHMVPAG
jgi:NTE family protein